jgi:hypothetical protein
VVLEQHHARPQPLDELDAVVHAVRDADRDQTRLRAQQHRQAGADGRLGVDDGDPDHGRTPSQPGMNPV